MWNYGTIRRSAWINKIAASCFKNVDNSTWVDETAACVDVQENIKAVGHFKGDNHFFVQHVWVRNIIG